MKKLNLKATLHIQRPKKEIYLTEEDILYPVRIRMTIQRVVTYQPAGFYLKKDQLLNGEVVNHINKTLLNSVIRKKINDIDKEKLEQHITGEAVTQRKKNLTLTFNEYALTVINRMKSTQAKVTITHKRSYLKKFNDFAPNIKLKDVNKEVLRKYEDANKAAGNKTNTIWSGTKFIKTMLNASVIDHILVVAPHKGFVGTKAEEPLRDTLTESELKLLEKFANNPLNNAKLLNVTNWFLFSCYCGLRFGDIQNFVGFNDGKVLMQTEKTKEIVSIFAHKNLVKIKERITGKIYSNQNTNDYLKLVADACNINKRVTFHLSRHTFAVQWLNKGGSMETLSKLLGHSTIKTTQIYGKISNYKIDNEVRKVFGK